jgi:hypothetical protein
LLKGRLDLAREDALMAEAAQCKVKSAKTSE